MKPRGVVCLAILFLITLDVKVSHSQTPSTPPSQRIAPQPTGWNPDIEKFLKTLAHNYAKAASYHDGGRIIMVQRSGRVKTTTEMPMELTFQRPNRLFFDGGQHQVACDGKSVTVAVVALRQFTTRPAPEQLEGQHLQAWSVMGGVEQGHPELVEFLLRPNAYELWQKQMTNVTWKPDAKIDDLTCRVLEYETLQGTRVRLYVDPNRIILLRVVAQTVTADQRIDVAYDLGSVTLNGPIDQKTFSFTPPRGFRRVEQFDPNARSAGHDEATHTANAPQIAPIVGKMAAGITGRNLHGNVFNAAATRGKVVLLFFWSLLGGEHSPALPVVQQVADHFQNNRDVLVLGISGDSGKPDAVAQLMEQNKCNFTTVFDEELKLRQAYQIGGEPTFVVVGRDNKITWARLGAPPTLRQDLVTEIEKALSSIVTP